MIHRRVALASGAEEPVTLQQALAHLRVTDEAEHAYIEQLIKQVRQAGESATNRSWLLTEWVVVLDAFPSGDDGIRLPAPPLVEVTSVSYVAEDGQTVSTSAGAWTLDADSEPAWLFPPPEQTWPTTKPQRNAVRIQCRCGYTPQTFPEDLRRWMLLHIGQAHEHREAATDNRLEPLPFVDGLLDPHRIYIIE